MKYAMFVVLACMLFGCVATSVPEANETVENITTVTPVEEIEEQDGAVETFSIESVNRVFEHGEYEFSDNSNPFSDGVGGDLGKTSTTYIKVDGMEFLSNDCEEEGQTFWFNLKTKDDKGVIFEAVYSVGLTGDCEQIKFLGKEYEIEIIDQPGNDSEKITRGGTIKLKREGSTVTLKDGGSLNNDDRWPVVLGWKDGELVKIIVYMGGYFYDIEAETNVVPLFGIDNSVLARFGNMETQPTFELITTDMTKAKN